MGRVFGREMVRRLVERERAQFELSPDAPYEQARLPGSRRVPPPALDGRVPYRREAGLPLVARGADHLCDREAWAAARLERLGFRPVHDAATRVGGTGGEAVRTAPVTVRADRPPSAPLERRDRSGTGAVPVHGSEGRLIGLIGLIEREQAGCPPVRWAEPGPW